MYLECLIHRKKTTKTAISTEFNIKEGVKKISITD